MDKPNYVARAKQLIGSAVRTTALVIMPLAAAVTAHADIIAQLPTGNFGCVSTQGPTCPSGAGDSQVQSVNSIQGVKLFTGGFVDIFNPSGGGFPNFLLLSAYGNFSGSLSGGYQMPVYYDFTLSGSGTDLSATTWTMGMELLIIGGDDVGQVTFSGSGVGTFSGYGTLTVSSGGVASGANLGVAVVFEVAESSGATDMQVNIPATSTDFNAVVPEPATGGLVAAALAALGLATRFRRKRES